MGKIVALNSGGFDSICLLHYLTIMEEEKDVHSLHFRYGELNDRPQMDCVIRACQKLGVTHKVITLPKFDWTQSKFYDDKAKWEVATQFLEWRNLVFLSYAVSYAQSIGADRIYMAILSSQGYSDTSKQFIEGLNSFLVPQGITICTPFDWVKDKTDLIPIATQCGIMPGEYFSCDKPHKNYFKHKWERCGECLDCLALDSVDKVLKVDAPFKALFQSQYDYENEKFISLLHDYRPNGREVRALINNQCQLKCKHCFYGFENMTEEQVDFDTYYNALKELVTKHGFTSIHFSGKEPLFDDQIVRYARKIKEDNLPCVFSVVTNGINVPKYIKDLKECGIEKVFLSADDVCSTNGVRTNTGTTIKAIKACQEEDVPVEVFIDLHKNNYDKVSVIIESLEEWGVHNIYVRTIRSIGNAKDQDRLTGEDLWTAFKQIEECADKYPTSLFRLSMSGEYFIDVFDHEKLSEVILYEDSLYTTHETENFSVTLERFCERYIDITLTPDGYVLGCASEVARPDYATISAGNIKRDTLTQILDRGDDMRCQCASKFPEDNFSCMVNKI